MPKEIATKTKEDPCLL